MSEDSSRKRRRLAEEKSGSESVLCDAPREIKIVEFAEGRAAEIEALTQSCESLGGAKRLFQTLPRHMRRRAMSHNVKRLPRRLRDQAAKEYEAKAQKKDPSKRPSRRYRRRPSNLLSEYSRRQRNNIWLETHIWHAKRFKMADQWGYRVPLRPSEKSSRASYRASAHHCLLQDISYHCCLELSGPESLLLDGLGHVTDTKTGKTFAAKASLDGSREGHTVMYSFQTYPYKAIGPVSFLWKPVGQSDHKTGQGDLIDQRQIWIWCHPSCYQQVWSELCRAFSLPTSETVANVNENMTKNAESKEAIDVNVNQSMTNGSIKLTLLKDKLIRYRMCGPLSQAILSDLLKKSAVSMEIGSENEKSWWQDYYKDKTREITHTQQWQNWNTMKTSQSPAELPPHCVLALTVRDPRIFLPPKKKMMTNSASVDDKDINYSTKEPVSPSMLCAPSPDLAVSPLWMLDVRKKASEKLTEQEINKQKSRLLIPGSVLDLGEKESRIPVLLIQRPDHQGEPLKSHSNNSNVASGFGSGWDIILPSGWGMAFWISLVYRGARVGGTREAENLHRELSQLYFPSDFPDTNSGKNNEDLQKKALEEKHSRYPPAKRPNFIKFGTPTPFYFPWKRVLLEWRESSVSTSISKTEIDATLSSLSKAADDFFILRNRILLQELSKHIDGNGVNESRHKVSKMSPEFLEEISTALVAVKVKMFKKGIPEKFASICLPTEEDLRKLKENPDYGGPVEPPHRDLSKETARKRKKTKTDGHTEKETIADGKAKLREEHLLDFNSRQTIGYLISGGFSLSQGHGTGLGFCSAIGLSHMEASLICLVRPQNSLQYRFVRLEIMT